MIDAVASARLFDPLSLAIVVGGSVLVAAIRSTGPDIRRAFVALKPLLFARPEADALAAMAAVRRIEAIANARTIACADRISAAGRFLNEAALRLSDARTTEDFVAWGQGEIDTRRARHDGAIGFWRTIADSAPAMGMIGTVAALIQMFAHMDDVAGIGPAMALAMLTTFYGVVTAGALAGPIAARLERLSALETGWQRIALDRLETLAREELDRAPGRARGPRLKAVP